ncbi:MAG: short-chain dehydrogenase [Acidimicrobiia bacterium]|nr:short-chain dehydrogenase [Acidimicrobiia bacterium]
MSSPQRVMVVSGGATGIGRATAEVLAADGDHVVIVGRRVEVLQAAADKIGADSPGSVSWVRADASDPADVQALVDRLRSDYGTIDAVINNAGGPAPAGGESLDDVARMWRAAFDQNVLSAVLMTEGLAPLLRRPGGRIILVSSMSTRSGGGQPAYGAAKSALHGWVLALTNRFGREGITANIVAPGYTPDTELFGAGMPQEIHDRIVSRIAVGRAGRSVDSAAAIRFLCSPEASFITSQILEVSGGLLPPNV